MLVNEKLNGTGNLQRHGTAVKRKTPFTQSPWAELISLPIYARYVHVHLSGDVYLGYTFVDMEQNQINIKLHTGKQRSNNMYCFDVFM